MSRNPWEGIPRPLGTDYFKTIVVEPELNPNDLPISWALDYEGNRAVYFEFPRQAGGGKDLKTPEFKSLSIRDIDCGRKRRALAVVLKATGMEDIFFEICCDLISSVQGVPAPSTRTMLIRRLERWSNLLKGDRSGLSAEQQRGLFAELLFLQRFAIPNMGEVNAIRGWIGPEKGRQDYRFGQTFIEVKSKRGAGANTITVSSEHQLYASDDEELFLYVVEENEANGNGGRSLTELATDIRDSLSSPIARAEYVGKMLRVDYDFKTNYETRWTIGKELVYLVDGAFPRIVDPATGLSRVTYALDLSVCVEYLSDAPRLGLSMRGNHG